MGLLVPYTVVTHPQEAAHRKDTHNSATQGLASLALDLPDNHKYMQLGWRLLKVTFTPNSTERTILGKNGMLEPKWLQTEYNYRES